MIGDETLVKVADLVCESVQWNYCEVLSFSLEITKMILTLPVSNNVADGLRWLYTEDDTLKVKSVYITLTSNLGNTSSIWKSIWGVNNQPRVKLFL